MKKVNDILLFVGTGAVFVILSSLLVTQSSAATVTNRVTGVAKWNTAANWIENCTGTITFTNASQLNRHNLVYCAHTMIVELAAPLDSRSNSHGQNHQRQISHELMKLTGDKN